MTNRPRTVTVTSGWSHHRSLRKVRAPILARSPLTVLLAMRFSLLVRGQRLAAVAPVIWVTDSLNPRRILVGRSAASQRDRRPGRVDRITSSNAQRCSTTRTASTGSATPISPLTLAPSSRIRSSWSRIRSRANRRPRSSPESLGSASSSSSSSSCRAVLRSSPSGPTASPSPPWTAAAVNPGSSCSAGVAGTTRWKWQSPPAIRSRMAAQSSSPPSVWLATTRYRRTTHHLPESDTHPASYARSSRSRGRALEEYRRLTDELPSFKEFLLAAPDLAELEIDRPPERARVVELAAQADDTP